MALMILLGAASGYAALLISQRMIRARESAIPENVLISKKITPLLWCLISGAGFAGLYLTVDNQYAFAEYAAVFTLCMCIGAVDWTIRKIPNSLLFALICCKICFLIINNNFSDVGKNLIGFGAAAIIFTLPALLRLNVGAGDTKLAAVTGLYLGIGGFLQAMIIMAVLISLYGVWLLISKKGGFRTKTAMGPYMAIGLISTLVFPIL